MTHPFVPLLVLVFAPLAYIAWRLRDRYPRALLAALAIAGLGVLAAGIAAGGVDFRVLDRMKLLLVAAATAAVALHHAGIPPLTSRRAYRTALIALALAAGVVWSNFFAFHGRGRMRVYVHLHDVAHYYLGSKYFAEAGYRDLYAAMLRAEAERFENHFYARQARDLETNAMRDIGALLRRSGVVKSRFTPERWHDFVRDVAYFRGALGPQWADVLRDHGFNPTPAWALVGGALAGLVPPGSRTGVFALTLLDPLLLLGLFGAAGWAFGLDALLLGWIYFCLVYGASFGWTGGGFLRYLWLFAVVVAAACVQKRRHGAAGALLGLATALVVFPVYFAAAIGARAAGGLLREGRFAREHARFLAGFATALAVLAGATLVREPGASAWFDFAHKIQRQLNVRATNIVGLGTLAPYARLPGIGAAGEAGTETGAAAARRVAAGVAAAVVLLFLAVRCARGSDAEAFALAVPALFLTLRLASYYYVFLVLVLLAERSRPRHVLLLWMLETASYVLALFENEEAWRYAYRNVLLAGVFLVLLAPAAREEAAAVRAWLRRPIAGTRRESRR